MPTTQVHEPAALGPASKAKASDVAPGAAGSNRHGAPPLEATLGEKASELGYQGERALPGQHLARRDQGCSTLAHGSRQPFSAHRLSIATYGNICSQPHAPRPTPHAPRPQGAAAGGPERPVDLPPATPGALPETATTQVLLLTTISVQKRARRVRCHWSGHMHTPGPQNAPTNKRHVPYRRDRHS